MSIIVNTYMMKAEGFASYQHALNKKLRTYMNQTDRHLLTFWQH